MNTNYYFSSCKTEQQAKELWRELSKKLDGELVIRNSHGTQVGITFRNVKIITCH